MRERNFQFLALKNKFMFIVSYDIENDRIRTKFSKFLKQYGRRIQYSVFEIKNSKRILDNIKSEIDLRYKKIFSNNDSVIIYGICDSCRNKIVRIGYPVQEEKNVVFFG